MADLAKLTAQNARRWSLAKITRGPEFARVADRLIVGKPRYQAVQSRTGVPWFVIAVIHEREASGKWSANIAQGDPWDEKSVHVPRGRGPFPGWEDAAIDALVNCAPYASKWKDWSAGGTMTLLECYNGLAYANANRPSPYVWSGTNQYTVGKVLVDHGPIEPVEDRQLGCAGLILALRALDPSVSFGDTLPPPPDVPAREQKTTPQPDIPARESAPSLISTIIKIFVSLFGRRK